MKRRLLRIAAPVLLAAALALSPAAGAQQQGLSADLHRESEQISELLKEERHAEAIGRIEALRKRSRLNSYEKAVLAQLLGFAQAGAGRPKEAAAAFEEALSHDALPAEIASGISQALVQMHVESEDFARARTLIEQILGGDDPVDPSFRAVAAYVYYELEDFAQAETQINLAIRAKSDDAPENWYQILLAIYRAQEQWTKAEAVLRDVIARHPDNATYWQFLSYTLYEQERDNESLATLMLAYRLGHIEGEDLERLVGMHANAGIPEKAARLLEQWLGDGALEATSERLSLAGRLWLLAREREEAIAAIAKAAEAADDGAQHVLLGKLYYEEQRWDEAVGAFQSALSRGDFDDERSQIELLLGICAFNAGDPDLARRSLETAGRTAKYRDHARYWLTRLEEEGPG